MTEDDQQTPEPTDQLPRMSLLEHLEELRGRILKALAAVIVGFLLCWAFAKPIANFLARPIYKVLPEGERLVFLGITDAFILYVKVALLAGLFLASPFVLYQIWRFVAPGLYSRERRHAFPFIFFGTLFFLGGGMFAYFVAFPFALEFLIQMGSEFEPQITVDRYYRFLLYIIFGLGVMFELPIVIFFLARIGVVTPRFLMRHFRWAVLIIFVMAAFITPTPDIVNLCLFAVPTIVLYLLGVAAAALVARKERKAAARLEEAADTDPQ
jgi:sec-independent protein translocase protein TatC